MTDCTEHLSCRLPAPLRRDHVDVVEIVHGSGRVSYALMVGDDRIGSVQDEGYTTHDGRWVERWEGFAGGGAVPIPAEVLGDMSGRDHAVQAVVEFCSRASFHIRMAMHP